MKSGKQLIVYERKKRRIGEAKPRDGSLSEDSISERKKRRIGEAKPRNPSIVLSEDVISDILSWLPVKTLLRLRCVAKSWSSLIISARFVMNHLRLSLNNKKHTYDRVMSSARPKILLEGPEFLEEGPEILQERPKILQECTLGSLFHADRNAVIDLSDRLISDGLLNELPETENETIILGSVNGLIGLIFPAVGWFLWNPTTRKYKILDIPLLPFSSEDSYGFGYDRFQDDYNIVATFLDEGHTVLKMYSLNSNSWKTIVANEAPLVTGFGKFVDGKLHWPSADRINGAILYESWRVVSFDLATEQWGVVEQPKYDDEEYDDEEHVDLVFHLGVLENDLAIFCDSVDIGVDVWVLKEYGVTESWTKLFAIEYTDDSGYYLSEGLSLPSFLLSYLDEILVMIGSDAKIYNSREGTFRSSRVIHFGADSKTQCYIESLVSP